MFKELNGEHDCINCVSNAKSHGPNNDSCICNQQMGECQIDTNNFVGGTHAKSEAECISQCSDRADCNHYTWYSKDSQTISEGCLFFSSCNEVDSCSYPNGGCFSGSLNCSRFHLGYGNMGC